jgi:hypothetical protein
MKARMITLALAVMLALVVGCKDQEGEEDSASSGSAPPETSYVGHNNYALIDGPVIGTNEVSNSNLRKGLTVTVVNSNPYLNAVRSWATRGSETLADSLFIRWIFLVKNDTANNAFCNINVRGISFKDAEGADLVTTALDDVVYGSVGLVQSKYLKSCLSPGEVGYVMQKISGVSADIYNAVEGVEIESISYDNAAAGTPTVSILPLSYTYDSSTDRLKLTAENLNDDTGYLWPATSFIILLDSEGLPVFWNELNKLSLIPIRLEKGEITEVETEELDFAGNVTKAKIILGFGVDAWNPAWSVK